MQKTKSGFTIVELLIVIVVIAILAAISVVAYNGIQQRARVNQTASAVNSYLKGFSLYASAHQRYPDPGKPYSCLGRPSCRGGTWQGSIPLDTALREFMGTFPQAATSDTIDSSTVGTVSLGYIDSSAGVTVDGVVRPLVMYSIEGTGPCPVGPVLSGTWPAYSSTTPSNGVTAVNGNNTVACFIALPRL